jgi:hypothetical protein
MGLPPSAYWNGGFEYHRGHGCLCLVSVCVLSGIGLCDGLITRPGSPTECGVSESDLETSKRRRSRPDLGCCTTGKKEKRILFYKYVRKGIIQYNTLPFTLRLSPSNRLDNRNRNSFPLMRLIFPQFVKKFPACFATQWFITVFLRSRYLSLSWARLIQYIPFYFSQMHLH